VAVAPAAVSPIVRIPSTTPSPAGSKDIPLPAMARVKLVSCARGLTAMPRACAHAQRQGLEAGSRSPDPVVTTAAVISAPSRRSDDPAGFSLHAEGDPLFFVG